MPSALTNQSFASTPLANEALIGHVLLPGDGSLTLRPETPPLRICCPEMKPAGRPTSLPLARSIPDQRNEEAYDLLGRGKMRAMPGFDLTHPAEGERRTLRPL